MHCARAVVVAALVVAGCAAPTPRMVAAKAPAAARPTSPDGRVKIGNPYQVFGQTYYPADDRNYDATGIASWYGPGFHSLSTASGERYDQDAVSAAHKTLPLPSYVEVSNLDNGRSLVVRVNDRGPFVAGRIIDLSKRSAQLLGVDRPGIARVRVRRVFPDAGAVAALQPPPGVAHPLPPPPVVPANAVAAAPLPPAPPGTVFVQVAALSDQGRAAWLRGFLAPYGPALVARSPAGLWRVRLGPFATREAANPVLAQVQAAGYTDARTVVAVPGG